MYTIDIVAFIGIICIMGGAIIGSVVTRTRTERRMQFGLFDGLTNLPNRTTFLDRLDQAILHTMRHRHQKKKETVAVLIIDLDGFKAVNDEYGHVIGDELLIAAATRIQECVRKSDTVARLGGDEFAVILTEIRDEDGCIMKMEEILSRLVCPFILYGCQPRISASIGAAIYPTNGADVRALLHEADTAMYIAKARGKLEGNKRGMYELAKPTPHSPNFLMKHTSLRRIK